MQSKINKVDVLWHHFSFLAPRHRHPQSFSCFSSWHLLSEWWDSIGCSVWEIPIKIYLQTFKSRWETQITGGNSYRAETGMEGWMSGWIKPLGICCASKSAVAYKWTLLSYLWTPLEQRTEPFVWHSHVVCVYRKWFGACTHPALLVSISLPSGCTAVWIPTVQTAQCERVN